MLRRLLPVGAAPEYRDASGTLVLAEVQVHLGWVGRRMAALEQASRRAGRLPHPARRGHACPAADTVYQEGDLVHVVAAGGRRCPRVETVLAAAPAGREH